MSSLRKIGRDHLAADLAQLERLIAKLTDEDVMMRFGLEERRDELRAEMQGLDEEQDTTASAALFFGGRPVIGGIGIESEFGGRAVATFQDLIAKQYTDLTVGLGQRGVVPNKAATRMHITSVVRGSFGFLLEELVTQPALLDTPLKEAVDGVSDLMGAFHDDDEEKFQLAAESLDERVLATARDFFSLLRQEGATFRIVAGDSDRSFDALSIDRAAERASLTTLEDDEEALEGVLAGVLPDGHLFEYRTQGERGIIGGRADKSIPSENLAALNRDWLERPSRAVVKTRKVLKSGELVRESFTLMRIIGRD
jgi:hypothetical protein